MAQMRLYLLNIFVSKTSKISPSTASSEIKYKREKCSMIYLVISIAVLYCTAVCNIALVTMTPTAHSVFPYIIILHIFYM